MQIKNNNKKEGKKNNNKDLPLHNEEATKYV